MEKDKQEEAGRMVPSVGWVVGAMTRARERTGTRDQIINAGFLGLCFLFIWTCLGLGQTPGQPLDLPLHHAIDCFAIAIPLLAIGYLGESIEAGREHDKQFVESLAAALGLLGWAGRLAAVVGLINVLLHYSAFAGMAFIAVAVLALPVAAGIARALMLLYGRALRQIEAREKSDTGEEGVPSPVSNARTGDAV